MTTVLTPVDPAPLAKSKGGYRRFERYSPAAAAVLLLIVLLLFGYFRYDGFLSAQAVLDLFRKNSFLIVLAVGMTFVILTGGIDLSVGAVMALGTVISAKLLEAGWPASVVIPVVLISGALIGLLAGLMIQYFGVQPFIATLAAMFLARGLSLVITDRSIKISDPFFGSVNLAQIKLGETTTMTGRGALRREQVTDVFTTWPVIIAFVVLIVAFVVLHYSRFGRTIYAIGGGESSANLMGLRVQRTKVSVYVISGFCAGLAGLLYAFYTAAGNPLAGDGYELNAIAAVVIGGTLLAGGAGYVFGSLIGVLTLTTIYAYKEFDGALNTGWTRVMVGALVLFFIVLQRILISRRK